MSVALTYRWCKLCKHTSPRNSQDARSIDNSDYVHFQAQVLSETGCPRPPLGISFQVKTTPHRLATVSSPTWHRTTFSGQPCPSGQSHHQWPSHALLHIFLQHSPSPNSFVPSRQKLLSLHKHPPILQIPSNPHQSPSSRPRYFATMPSPSRPAPSRPSDAWMAL